MSLKFEKSWLVSGLVAVVAVTIAAVVRVRGLTDSPTALPDLGVDGVVRSSEAAPRIPHSVPKPGQHAAGLDDLANPEDAPELDSTGLETYRTIFRSNEVELAQRLTLTHSQLDALKRVHGEIIEEAEVARQRGEDPQARVDELGPKLLSDFYPLLTPKQADEYRRWGRQGAQNAADTMAVREVERLQKTLGLDDERVSHLMVAFTDAYTELRAQGRHLPTVEYLRKEADLKKQAARPILSAKQFATYAQIVDGQLEAHEFSLSQADE
jgi:hypothetical protein